MKNTVPTRGFFRSLSTLGKVTTIALLINALVYFLYIAIVYSAAGIIIIPLVIIGLVTLLVTIIMAIGWRWTPMLGAVIALATSSGSFSQPYFPNDLEHPANSGLFIPVFIIMVSACVAIVAGIAATIQNYRQGGGERSAPRGLNTLLTGIVLGAMLVSFIAAANPQTSAATNQSGGEPVVHMGVTSFVQNVVLVPKGSKLKLTNDGQFDHVIQSGSWDTSGTAKPASEPGAPAVSNLNINGGSAEIGPFTTAGIYHLYCSVHHGMNLTVVVQ